MVYQIAVVRLAGLPNRETGHDSPGALAHTAAN